MLDLDAIEARVARLHPGPALPRCYGCNEVLRLVAALRAVLETTPEELVALPEVQQSFTSQDICRHVLATLTRKVAKGEYDAKPR